MHALNASTRHAVPVPAGYDALRGAVAWADLGRRTTILATGKDAVRFVDNFTTAAISKLAPGQGAEGFFTDSKGWVLALANIFRTASGTAGEPGDGLWIDVPAGLTHSLHEHLEHYHIREQIELVDASDDHASLLVAGPGAAAWLTSQCGDGPLPVRVLDHVRGVIVGIPVVIARIDWAGSEGFLVRVARVDRQKLVDHLGSTGVVEAERDAVEAVRIEEGWPEPADIPEKTLPQELGRDARAISFTKGCYLGQETVARIDALGHVNRRFVAVAADGPMAVGAAVRSGGETIGTITSACRSPLAGGGLGLTIALVKRLGPDAALEIEGLPARIVTVPVRAATASTAEGRHDG